MRRLVILASLLFALPIHAAPTFVPLGVLHGATASWATAVSADGSTVVGYSYSGTIEQAFRWTEAEGMQSLGVLPGMTYSEARGASADGSVVVGVSISFNGSSAEAFRWTKAEGMQGLGVLPGMESSSAFYVSADGSAVVGFSASFDRFSAQAFRWTEALGMQSLGVLPGTTFSQPTGVSADGSVVVGNSSDMLPPGTPPRPFRWTQAGGMQGLGLVPGATYDSAAGVSADGSVIGGYGDRDTGEFAWFRWTDAGGLERLGGAGVIGVDAISADGSTILGGCFNESPNNHEACRWTEGGGIQRLGILPGAVESYESAISADGSTIIGHSNNSLDAAFVWDPAHGMRDVGAVLTQAGLDLTGWQLQSADAISADGLVIVGRQALGPSGRAEAWLATLPGPEACRDGVDDDGDGLVDYPADPGCDSATDDSERSPTLACDDGIDNDSDGLVDMADPGCPFPYATIENPQCDDGIDNDGNGFTDFADTKCQPPSWPYWETPPPGCGLGAELALLMPLLGLATSRRRRANQSNPQRR